MLIVSSRILHLKVLDERCVEDAADTYEFGCAVFSAALFRETFKSQK